jgi:murein DD-endopeptidase MepM/ murein hydrolase activator NlpD
MSLTVPLSASLLLFLGCVLPSLAASNPCAPVASLPTPTPAERALTAILNAMNAQDADAVFALWGEDMARAVPRDQTRGLTEGVVAGRGCLTASQQTAGGAQRGTFLVTAERGQWLVEIAADASGGAVQGLRFSEPPAETPVSVASAEVPALPFRGEWMVLWGGDTPALNHHLKHPSQRRAADLVKVDEDGATHSGSGQSLTDYYAYGAPVQAVAGGVVAWVVDGVPDTHIGSLNPYYAPGNAIAIAHADGIWSVYAHLIPGSARVAVGDRVTPGMTLGECGNSGNSSEPHLHFQLQDGPRFEASVGVEATFDGVRVRRDGAVTSVDGYTFRKGDIVAGVPVGGPK